MWLRAVSDVAGHSGHQRPGVLPAPLGEAAETEGEQGEERPALEEAVPTLHPHHAGRQPAHPGGRRPQHVLVAVGGPGDPGDRGAGAAGPGPPGPHDGRRLHLQPRPARPGEAGALRVAAWRLGGSVPGPGPPRDTPPRPALALAQPGHGRPAGPRGPGPQQELPSARGGMGGGRRRGRQGGQCERRGPAGQWPQLQLHGVLGAVGGGVARPAAGPPDASEQRRQPADVVGRTAPRRPPFPGRPRHHGPAGRGGVALPPPRGLHALLDVLGVPEQRREHGERRGVPGVWRAGRGADGHLQPSLRPPARPLSAAPGGRPADVGQGRLHASPQARGQARAVRVTSEGGPPRRALRAQTLHDCCLPRAAHSRSGQRVSGRTEATSGGEVSESV